MHAGSGPHQDIWHSLPFPWFHMCLHRLSGKIQAEVLKCCNIGCVMWWDSVNHQVQSHIPSVNIQVLPIDMTLIDVQHYESGKPCCKAIPNAIPMCFKTQCHVPSEGLSEGLYILIWVGMDISLNQQAPCQSHSDLNWLPWFIAKPMYRQTQYSWANWKQPNQNILLLFMGWPRLEWSGEI